MTKCKDCKYFDTSDNYPEHLGWCDLELPPWLYQSIGLLDHTDITTVVRKDCQCDLGVEK
jgi:hypothetical protein